MVKNITLKRLPPDMIVFRLIVVLVSILACFGCASKPPIFEVKPGKVDVGRVTIRDVVLLRFDGPYGETLQRHVYHRLNEVVYFHAMDTTGHPALDEVSFDMIEDAERFHISEELEADIMIAARATGAIDDVGGTDQIEVKEGTGYFKKEKNLDGDWVDVEIKRTVVRPVPYVIRRASLTADYKVFELSTGSITGTGTLTEDYDKKFGGGRPEGDLEYQPGEVPSQAASVDELSAKLANKLVAKISRMTVAGTVEFDKGRNELVRRGVSLATRGNWEGAIQLWNDAISQEPTNAAAYYNLGVAHESLGDLKNLQTAKGLYEIAASYSDRPLYAHGVTRVQRMIDQRKDH
jgi:hypothetical protein